MLKILNSRKINKMQNSEIGVTIIDNEDDKSIHVLFAGTSLEKDSTLIENYDFIQYKLNDIFDNWNDIDKNSYFVSKSKKESLDDRYGLEQIQRDKYVFKEPIHNKLIIDFLTSSRIKFDIIILTNFTNLIDLFYDSKTVRSLFDIDIKELFKRIKDFYHGFKSNGILVNLYYNEVSETTSFSNFEMVYNYSSMWSLDVHLFIIKILNQIFKKLEPGVYQKEKISNIDTMITNTYNSLIEELFNLSVDKLEKKEELIETIDKKYFGETLVKSNRFALERPILANLSILVHDALKSME